MQSQSVSDTSRSPMATNALKFALWLFIASIIMIFASLTSAYIVRKGEGNWLEFQLPALFYVNSVIIVLSSISMQFAYLSAKKDLMLRLRVGLLLTLGIGLIFLVLQWQAWLQLVDMNIYFVGNPSGSFVYVLSGLHGAHIVAGLVFLLIVFYLSIRGQVHASKTLWIEICTTFWHFLGGLWLYLFFFLILNR